MVMIKEGSGHRRANEVIDQTKRQRGETFNQHAPMHQNQTRNYLFPGSRGKTENILEIYIIPADDVADSHE